MSVALALDPHQLHARLVAAAKAHRAATGAMAVGLADSADTRAFVTFGYATLVDYAVAELDLTPREARDLLGLGRRIRGLPAITAALDAGEIRWTKAREIARVAVRDTERAWLRRVGEVNSRTLEAEVAAASRGDYPRPLGEIRPRDRVRLVFEVDACDADRVRAMISAKRAQIGAGSDELSDGAVLAQAAEDALAALEIDDAKATERHQIVIHLCPTCSDAVANVHNVSDTVLATASCEAEHVDLQPGPTYGHRRHAVAPSVRAAVLARAGRRCEVVGCGNRRWLDVHHLKYRRDGGGETPENLCCLCPAHHGMLHDGILAIERGADGRLRGEHQDGRRWVGRASAWEPGRR